MPTFSSFSLYDAVGDDSLHFSCRFAVTTRQLQLFIWFHPTPCFDDVLYEDSRYYILIMYRGLVMQASHGWPDVSNISRRMRAPH